jgi:hypothetical protein
VTRLNPCHYVWTTEEDGQHWAYCYCAWTSPRSAVRIDALKAGERHIREVKFPFIEEGFSTEFEVISEFIGRGVGSSQIEASPDPEARDTWTVTAQTEDGEVFVTIRRDAEQVVELWHACDGATGVEFLVGDLETVVSAAAGVIKRAEAIDAITA